MRHSMAAEWRFRYELRRQTSPVDAPVPVDQSTRTYESRWLAERGSDEVVATATIETAGDGIVAVIQEADVESAGVGDHWWYLLENYLGDTTVIAHGVVTVQDDT